MLQLCYRIAHNTWRWIEGTIAMHDMNNGAYRVLGTIGAGSGGIIHKAWDNNLQKPVILKELRLGTAINTEAQRKEADILKNLKHPYLPQVLNFFPRDKGCSL